MRNVQTPNTNLKILRFYITTSNGVGVQFCFKVRDFATFIQSCINMEGTIHTPLGTCDYVRDGILSVSSHHAMKPRWSSTAHPSPNHSMKLGGSYLQYPIQSGLGGTHSRPACCGEAKTPSAREYIADYPVQSCLCAGMLDECTLHLLLCSPID
jgi:hypothetical protein